MGSTSPNQSDAIPTLRNCQTSGHWVMNSNALSLFPRQSCRLRPVNPGIKAEGNQNLPLHCPGFGDIPHVWGVAKSPRLHPHNHPCPDQIAKILRRKVRARSWRWPTKVLQSKAKPKRAGPAKPEGLVEVVTRPSPHGTALGSLNWLENTTNSSRRTVSASLLPSSSHEQLNSLEKLPAFAEQTRRVSKDALRTEGAPTWTFPTDFWLSSRTMSSVPCLSRQPAFPFNVLRARFIPNLRPNGWTSRKKGKIWDKSNIKCTEIGQSQIHVQKNLTLQNRVEWKNPVNLILYKHVLMGVVQRLNCTYGFDWVGSKVHLKYWLELVFHFLITLRINNIYWNIISMTF